MYNVQGNVVKLDPYRRQGNDKCMDRNECELHACLNEKSINGISESPLGKKLNPSGSKQILIARSSIGADDIYISYNLFINPLS